MNYLIIGLGNQGIKRSKTINKKNFSTIDPFNLQADFKTIDEAIKFSKLKFSSAIICTPDLIKYEMIIKCLHYNLHVL
ncbi:hypothetical protein OA977_03885, partial [Pelagibacteraceae bacterium]|nr:hypothetical protein [Pelagibacteraceae bacterium]